MRLTPSPPSDPPITTNSFYAGKYTLSNLDALDMTQEVALLISIGEDSSLMAESCLIRYSSGMSD